MGLTYYLISNLQKSEGKKLIFQNRLFIYFCFPLLLTIYLINPILWINPLEIVNAFVYMSQHPWQGNTLTGGRLFEPGNLLYLYIPLWLSVKLPLVVICGLILMPLVLIRNAASKKVISAPSLSLLVGLTFSVISIVFLFRL